MAKCVAIESVELFELDAPIDVHDIEVEIDHSFIVGGIVAHNCERCAVRDMLWWDLDGVPQDGNTLPWEAPPLHYNCRCTTTARLKLFSEQGIDLPDLPLHGGGRASTDGPVKGDTNFDTWFRGRTPEEQNEQFGKGKADLYRSGKITLRDLLDLRGNPLTLAQLKAKYK